MILPVPPGITPDSAANFGLFALINNINAYSDSLITIVTAGTNTTLTAAQLDNGAIRLTAGASGAFTLALPSTVAILAAMGPTILVNGTFSQHLYFINDNVGQTATVTVGDASTTLTGTATIATNTVREFLMIPTSASTITLQNIGTRSL